jgi:hypothetical protein
VARNCSGEEIEKDVAVIPSDDEGDITCVEYLTSHLCKCSLH